MSILGKVNTTSLRRKRYERIVETLDVRPEDKILDVGCGRGARSIAAFNESNDITGIDIFPTSEFELRQDNVRYMELDASDLHPFADDSFDVAVSVGMLEHIRPTARLLAVIREVQRVAHRYCFVVPHRYAFLEPHYYLPMFSIWPAWSKTFLIKRHRLGTQERQPSGRWQRINWLSRRQWKQLFADPNLVIKNHWYGPLLQYYLIFGGQRPTEKGRAQSRAE
jgi:SAM-dependent methyltransferase